MEALLFTLVILVRGNRHLLPLTLDTLNVQSKVPANASFEGVKSGVPANAEGGKAGASFEVILLDGEGSGRLQETTSRYSQFPIQVKNASGDSVSAMMNRGVEMARGQYIQFLEPGDRYISQQGLSYLKQIISESGKPHLIYSSHLSRGPDQNPQAVSLVLNKELLQKGAISRSTWFSKEAIQQMGGFDDRLSYRPIFDLLCKMYMQEGTQAVYTRRVLTDTGSRRLPASELIGFANETCKILYRHFGFWHALKWIFVQEHLQIFRWLWSLLRHSFCKNG